MVAYAEVEQLRQVHAWAVAHPALGDDSVLSTDEHPGGAGTPGVAAFTAEPLATALRLSPSSAQRLLADTLDLAHRLPRLWEQTQALLVPVWKARRIATATRSLSVEAANWVDRQLVGAAASMGTAALDRLISTAVARVDAEAQAEREAAERARWDVTLIHPRRWAGTSELTATGDTLVLTDLHARMVEEADTLAAAGDDDPAGARRVKALAHLVRHGADQLAFGFDQAADSARKPAGRPKVRLYLHADLNDVVASGSGGDGIGTVERLGPITRDLLKTWVGHSQVTVVPVIALNLAPHSPRHDPPPRMVEQVVLTDQHCVFPYCQVRARACDLDHVENWRPAEESGADPPRPGTTPDNLAPLCRRHHRLKTAGTWNYDALGPDHYAWTGPHGQELQVVGGTTVPLPGRD